MLRLFKPIKIRPPKNRAIPQNPAKMQVKGDFKWPNKTRGAISLTYDDGLSNHLDVVAPALESVNLRGTFYPHITSIDFQSRTDEWEKLTTKGHELGNHMVFHPCLDNHALHPDYNLANYTTTRWDKEADLANWTLRRIDGKTRRTFGNTCWDNWLGPPENRTCLESLIPQHFFAARGELSEAPIDPKEFNPYNLGTFSGDYYTFKEIREIITDSISGGKWLIITFHCVGKHYNLYVEQKEHEKLLEWVKDQASEIWTKPMGEVAEYLIQRSNPLIEE
jgi:peptidoglycan/xylan/chitin deacetylase (PgdA/CDA1 family)